MRECASAWVCVYATHSFRHERAFMPPGREAPRRGSARARSPLPGHRRARPVRTRVEVLDESRACGCPAEKLPCRRAGRRQVHAEKGADPPEMTLEVTG